MTYIFNSLRALLNFQWNFKHSLKKQTRWKALEINARIICALFAITFARGSKKNEIKVAREARVCKAHLTLNPILRCNFCRIKKFSDSIAFRLIAPENTLLEANARFLSIVRIEKCSSEVLHAGTVHSVLSIFKGKARQVRRKHVNWE